MCIIFKTADRRVKWMAIWDSWSYELHMYGTFRVQFFEFTLGSFGALCKISGVKISTGPPVFIQFQPNLAECM